MDDDIKDLTRLEVTATKETTFFGLNDRILSPLFFLMVFSIVLKTWLLVIAFIVILIIELVKKVMFKLSWSELGKSTWASINEKTRKSVRN